MTSGPDDPQRQETGMRRREAGPSVVSMEESPVESWRQSRRQTRFYVPNRRSTAYRLSTSHPHHRITFKPFTRDSLAEIEERRRRKLKQEEEQIARANIRAARHSVAAYQLEQLQQQLARQDPEPDPSLASGNQLPLTLARQLPDELVGKPLEEIDPYYGTAGTFVIVSRSKELTRFSAMSPIFNLLVITTILANCILMTLQGAGGGGGESSKDSDRSDNTEIFFTIVYTTEMCLKVLARGFIMEQFTYLRDPWNWLDFTVILMAYLTIVIEDLGNLSVMRTFRVLRALKTVAIIPGMKTIVGAVIDSVKNLKDVVVLTLFSLSVFSLLGLQIYMGQLTQKCVLDGPSNMTDGQWLAWCSQESHWIPDLNSEIPGNYRLCGNATGAQSCPQNYTCLQGFGKNPDYGFTNFDTFGWALICSFRLMTQDYWEGLYMQVLKTAGSWHILFFIVSIFLGSIYLMNLILAIVAMSYNELQRRAEEEEEAAAEDEANFLDSCRRMEERDRQEQQSRVQPPADWEGASVAHHPPSSSFRPSLEIGMAGHALLASLCQGRLLDEQLLNQRLQPLVKEQSHAQLPSSGIRRASSLRSTLATAARPSATDSPAGKASVSSDKDLKDLRQQAALIRIVSGDCLEGSSSGRDKDSRIEANKAPAASQLNVSHGNNLLNVQVPSDLRPEMSSHDSCSSLRAGSYASLSKLNHTQKEGRYLSDLAICSQPTSNKGNHSPLGSSADHSSTGCHYLSVERFPPAMRTPPSRRESHLPIHPSTMVRHSMSRPRHSLYLSPGGGMPAAMRGVAGQQTSRDFQRRASEWSRVSMSTNVDLRRLLRLWSHTNPYQGRGSVVSGQSSGSQTGPARWAAANHSPRPSSVGSARQTYELISALSRRHDLYPADYELPLDGSGGGASDAIGSSNEHREEDDNLSINCRDKSLAYCLSCLDVVCIWECCEPWIRCQRCIGVIVFDPFTELFIILCIVINTLFMALDSDDADPQMRSIFERGNYFFTATFAVEALMKIVALSPKFYFREGWNLFDSLIVGLSLLELGLEGVYGLSVLRSFRLLRVFKLAKSWPTLNLLISIMGKAVGDLGNLTFVLAIIVFIFAVMGMQLFGAKYEAQNFPNEELPRWNFTDFMHSFMIVFRILCAEWVEPMWDCLLVGGWPCIPFFLIAVTVGNLVVFNLFLALLLASFGASNLSSPQTDNVDTKKLHVAIQRFVNLGAWLRANLLGHLWPKNKKSHQDQAGSHPVGQPTQLIVQAPDAGSSLASRTEAIQARIRDCRSATGSLHLKGGYQGGEYLQRLAAHESRSLAGCNYNYQQASRPVGQLPTPIPIIVREPEDATACSPTQPGAPDHPANVQPVGELPAPEEQEKASASGLYLRPPSRQNMDLEDERELERIERQLEHCICLGILYLRWFLFRQTVRRIVEHRYFDQCILALIVISSLTLALEDKHLDERPNLKRTLDTLDTIFTIVFSLEMIFKWLAFGLRRYFGHIWYWLDFVIVMVSFINLMASIFGSGKLQALKTIRTLRAMRGLRPLRALQRFQGMRVVVNALIQAIPSIFNVLLVCLIFWLIFSIMGVQMFGGKFWRCLDPISKELVSYERAANKVECITRNLTWSNPQINFDNVFNAYLALFQVATFKGWIDIMNSASDCRARDQQPIREANIYMYFYFVFFVIFGSFFTLNLFIGVIIDNFNEQKKKTGGSLEILMTEDQKKYYHAMKKMRSKRPIKAMTRPKFKFQAYAFDLTTSKRFDLAIMLVIGMNMFVMALEHYGQSPEFSSLLENLNLVFIGIFTLECLTKIFAMRHFYFREPWNLFDLVVVSLSILGVLMKEYVAKYFVSPTLLRVVRVVKVGRVLRLVKGAKGIRTLLFALAMSLPALLNICLLLFLVMFIYAIFGMSFFMHVRPRNGIDETFNFATFSSSMVVLFEVSTSAGFDLILDPLMDEENDCQKADPSQGIEGTCGNKSIAIFYLTSYVIVTFFIIINMYIAVILENYSQATEDVQEGLTDDDYEMYYEIWQRFDPDGTQYLAYSKLSDFVEALEDPLRIPKPNELALVVMDINIYQGDRCYCVDILDALTKFFFARKGLVIQENEHLKKVQSTLHETPFEKISSTYLLKREHYCAKVIQNTWRKWRQKAQENRANQSDDKDQNKH